MGEGGWLNRRGLRRLIRESPSGGLWLFYQGFFTPYRHRGRSGSSKEEEEEEEKGVALALFRTWHFSAKNALSSCIPPFFQLHPFFKGGGRGGRGRGGGEGGRKVLFNARFNCN